jgi:hypothetical protein
MEEREKNDEFKGAIFCAQGNETTAAHMKEGIYMKEPASRRRGGEVDLVAHLVVARQASLAWPFASFSRQCLAQGSRASA